MEKEDDHPTDKAGIELMIDGEPWHQVRHWQHSGPDNPHYVGEISPDGTAVITFGDGQRGRRMPTGSSEIRVSFDPSRRYTGVHFRQGRVRRDDDWNEPDAQDRPCPSRPEVILDFIFDAGLFFISIRNIGHSPAFKVSVRFDKKILAPEGGRHISDLPLFQNIEFLAPQKEIRTFLDTTASYFRRGQPTEISVRISYADSAGRRHARIIDHNLEIYRDLSYIKSPMD